MPGLVLAGCGGAGRPTPGVGARGDSLAALSAAIAATDTTRTAVLTAQAHADAAVGDADRGTAAATMAAALRRDRTVPAVLS